MKSSSGINCQEDKKKNPGGGYNILPPTKNMDYVSYSLRASASYKDKQPAMSAINHTGFSSHRQGKISTVCSNSGGL